MPWCYVASRLIGLFMLTVVVPTLNSERALVPTLAMLVPGAVTGTVRQVIIADGGSTDATAEVADIAGCELMVSDAPLAVRLQAAAKAARAPWLMFLRPGVVLDPTWVEETTRYIDGAVARGSADSTAAVFRNVSTPHAAKPVWREALALFKAALGGPRPEQGLVISKRHYFDLGGHRHEAPDPEADLVRRLGRRRLVTLRSGATNVDD